MHIVECAKMHWIIFQGAGVFGGHHISYNTDLLIDFLSKITGNRVAIVGTV